MQENFYEINSVPTKILTWGYRVDEEMPANVDKLVLIITGKLIHSKLNIKLLLSFL